MKKVKTLKLLVAAGGTGGHLFPALAVVEQLQSLVEHFDAVFVGNSDRIEGRIVSGIGFKLNHIPIRGLNKLLSVNTLLLPLKIYSSIQLCRKIIRSFQPDAILCTGAYISYPAGIAASREKIPLILMESNVYPGKTIKMLAPRASLIVTAFPDSYKYFQNADSQKIEYYGNPVRNFILNMASKEEGSSKFELDPNKKTVLVFGGSLGAKSINEAVKNSLTDFIENNIQLIWQTGSGYQTVPDLPETVKSLQFIDDMASAYAASDLVVSRSGATSIAEICIAGKPSILVPYPFAANNHQDSNADLLVNKGAAVKVHDNDASSMFPKLIKEYINNEGLLKKMADSAKSLAKPDAALKTAERIIELL